MRWYRKILALKIVPLLPLLQKPIYATALSIHFGQAMFFFLLRSFVFFSSLALRFSFQAPYDPREVLIWFMNQFYVFPAALFWIHGSVIIFETGSNFILYKFIDPIYVLDDFREKKLEKKFLKKIAFLFYFTSNKYIFFIYIYICFYTYTYVFIYIYISLYAFKYTDICSTNDR